MAYFLSGCLPPQDCEKLVPLYLDDYFRELVSALRAHGVAVAAAGAEAGAAGAETLGFPRQLLDASGVKALDDGRGAAPDSAGSPTKPEPRGMPSFVSAATRS